MHTFWLCCEHFSHDSLKYRTARTLPTVPSRPFASIRTAPLHDPGERGTDGFSVDWLGCIVEPQRNVRLGEPIQERIFAPLTMAAITFTTSHRR